jgi:hypothetical protein
MRLTQHNVTFSIAHKDNNFTVYSHVPTTFGGVARNYIGESVTREGAEVLVSKTKEYMGITD